MSLECLKSVQENLEQEKEAVLQNLDGEQTHRKKFWFNLTPGWKQPKCPSVDEWINKVWYIHMGY